MQLNFQCLLFFSMLERCVECAANFSTYLTFLRLDGCVEYASKITEETIFPDIWLVCRMGIENTTILKKRLEKCMGDIYQES